MDNCYSFERRGGTLPIRYHPLSRQNSTEGNACPSTYTRKALLVLYIQERLAGCVQAAKNFGRV
jgi:hypothetical protein